MNLKEYVNQVYELRLIQSSKALLSFFMEQKIALPINALENLDKDKQMIENFYTKMMINGEMLTDEEIDELLSIYLIYSDSVSQMYQSRNQHNVIEKYAIYLMTTCCIYKYYKVESMIYELLNKQEDSMLQDILDTCLITRDLLYGLIMYEEFKNKKGNTTGYNMEKKKQLEERFQNLKETDITLIVNDIEEFISDCLDEVLYPVKHEYNRQILYIQKKNEIMISGCANGLREIFRSLKNKSSDSEETDDFWNE